MRSWDNPSQYHFYEGLGLSNPPQGPEKVVLGTEACPFSGVLDSGGDYNQAAREAARVSNRGLTRRGIRRGRCELTDPERERTLLAIDVRAVAGRRQARPKH